MSNLISREKLLEKIFRGITSGKTSKIDMDKIASLLNTSPEALQKFEEAYGSILDKPSEGMFGINSRQASEKIRTNMDVSHEDKELQDLLDRIVEELLDDVYEPLLLEDKNRKLVSNAEIRSFPEAVRPQLTGKLMKVDIDASSYPMLMFYYDRMKNGKTEKDREYAYHSFRQGLDILDLDPVVYEIIGMNRNSMGYWLPKIHQAATKHGFFKIPETKIIKVPMTLLQLTRCDYFSLTPSTLKIVDDFCMKAFDLDVNKTYFIKTGTYSSKFDFRNAKVTGEKEVRELGEYLLYIHFQALQMASPLNQPSIYGVSTTNEWVVREFIEDKESNPQIYKGLPLHTEYRVFVDFDSDEFLGISPYWEPELMKKRFLEGSDKSVHDKHDYVIYKSHEHVLMRRYEENKDQVIEEIKKLIPDTDLAGQWAIDIMQNGKDFWLIDMSLAANSALSECVPPNKLRKAEERWIPDFSNHKQMRIK